MKLLKEKCIYYNPSNECYYLVLHVSDIVCGRCGDIENPSYLDRYMNQDGTGLRLKIDNIIINSDYIRNYHPEDKALDEFELVRELTDKEFYLMEILIYNYYKHPPIIIDIHEHMNEVSSIVNKIRRKEIKSNKIKKEINILTRRLYDLMSQE